MIDHPSPNHDPRPHGTPVDMLVLHYTGMESGASALARLCDPEAKVSAHYLIEEDGRIFRLVPEERRAWHAGVAFWRGHRDINARSIGIELVNPGHEFGYRDFPPVQIEALTGLAHGILGRHPIPPRNVVGHSDVAPTRKTDPGERFPWQALARAGIGIWPEKSTAPQRVAAGDPGDTDERIAAAQRLLGRLGYEIKPTGLPDDPTMLVIAAFQRRFRPSRVDGRLDGETLARLAGAAAVADGDTA